MSEQVINPEGKDDSNGTKTQAQPDNNENQGTNETPNNASQESRQLTIPDVQNLIAEALANFKSELMLKDVSESDGENESEEPKKERSL